MSDNNFFSDSFSNSLSSIRKVPSSFLEDKLSKEILPYEIEFASKNSNIVFPLYEKMRYNKMKELVPYDNYIGRYIITKNLKDFNSSNNNNGILWKINAVDNMILKLENISAPGTSMSLSSSNNIINNSKNNLIDLGDIENESKIFLVEYTFLSKSLPKKQEQYHIYHLHKKILLKFHFLFVVYNFVAYFPLCKFYLKVFQFY